MILHILVETFVAYPDQPQIEYGGPVARADGEIIEQRRLLPGTGLVLHRPGKPLGRLIGLGVGVVATLDTEADELRQDPINGHPLFRCGFENPHQPPAHAVVASRIGDEPGLMRGILPAVGKDADALLPVVIGRALVLTGEAFGKTLGDHAHRAEVPSATGVSTS